MNMGWEVYIEKKEYKIIRRTVETSTGKETQEIAKNVREKVPAMPHLSSCAARFLVRFGWFCSFLALSSSPPPFCYCLVLPFCSFSRKRS